MARDMRQDSEIPAVAYYYYFHFQSCSKLCSVELPQLLSAHHHLIQGEVSRASLCIPVVHVTVDHRFVT